MEGERGYIAEGQVLKRLTERKLSLSGGGGKRTGLGWERVSFRVCVSFVGREDISVPLHSRCAAAARVNVYGEVAHEESPK